MKRAISVVATVATLFAATSATAADHIIIMLPDAYFPETTYVKKGDMIRFINSTGQERTIISDDESWEIGPIPGDASHVLHIEDGIALNFADKDAVSDDGTFYIKASLSFDTPPYRDLGIEEDPNN